MAVKKNEFADDYRRRLEEVRRLSETGDELDVLERLKELVCMCGGEVPCKDGLDSVDLPNGPSVFTRVWYDSGNDSLKADYHSDWDGDERIRTMDLDDCVWAAGYVVPFMENESYVNGLQDRPGYYAFPLRYVKLDRKDFYDNDDGSTECVRVHNKLVSVGGTTGFRYGWSKRSRDPFVCYGSGPDRQVRGIGSEGLYVVRGQDGKVGLHDPVTFGILFEKGFGRTCRPSGFLNNEMNEAKANKNGLKR